MCDLKKNNKTYSIFFSIVDSEEQIRKISNLSNVFRPNDAIKDMQLIKI
jgi:hypothetical protein